VEEALEVPRCEFNCSSLAVGTDISKVSWLVVNAFDAVWITYCLWIPSMIFLTGP
jgi:hypothetical protein